MSDSSKRKRAAPDQPKYYAVRVGRRPGIYPTWQACLPEVTGFPRAIYKSFTTQADAERFISPASKHTSTWYAVRHGRAPGLYRTWQEVQPQIDGFHNAQYKKFDSQAEAESFLQAAHESLPPADSARPAESGMPPAKKLKVSRGRQDKNNSQAAEPVNLADYAPGEAPLPPATEDGFDATIILDEESGALRYRTEEEKTRLTTQAVRPVKDRAVVIHTDGSTLRNGQPGAISGVGVYFGPADKRNVSEALAGKKQTNQRAELTGLVRALELAPRDRRLIIKTDSRYSIQCVTEWFLRWRENGWLSAQRKAVDNKDLVSKIIDLLEERIRINRHRQYTELDDAATTTRQHWDHGPAGVRFEWLKGHSIHEGNQAADVLAVQGARKASELDSFADDDNDF